MPQPRAEHDVADRHVPAMRSAFLAGLPSLDVRAILAAVRSGQTSAVLEAIPWRDVENQWIETIQPVLREVFAEAADDQVADVPLAAVQKLDADEFAGRFGFRFDLTNPLAVQWLTEHSATLVQDITAESQLAIREVLGQGFGSGLTVPRQAQFIRDLIGLDTRRALSLARFQQAQIDQDLSESVIERNTVTYRRRLVADRAKTVARTETITGAAEGQRQLWLQMLAQGVLADTVRRRVAVTPDERLCPVCAPMPSNPVNTVGLDQPFLTGDGRFVLSPAFHPLCRCSAYLVFPDQSGVYPSVPSETPAYAGGQRPRRRGLAPRARRN